MNLSSVFSKANKLQTARITETQTLQIIEATNFLQGNPTIVERAYCIHKGITHQPICAACPANLRMKDLHAGKSHVYATYCSVKCSNTNREINYDAVWSVRTIDQRKNISDAAKMTRWKKFGVDPVLLQHVHDPDWWKMQYDLISSVGISRKYNMPYQSVLKLLKRHQVDKSYHWYSSDIERQIGDYVTNVTSLSIESNYRIDGHEFDLWIPEKRIAIEVNGIRWHSEHFAGRGKQYHKNKQNYAIANNIKLLQFWDIEWSNVDRRGIMQSMILHKLGTTKMKIGARTLYVRKITSSEASSFLKIYHLQGSGAGCGVAYGLVDSQGIIKAVMTFAKSRYSTRYQWELIRYATQSFTAITGGASKLLKFFEKEHKPTSLISYSDIRTGTGEVYSKLGFNLCHESKPNYFYFKGSNPTKLMSRVVFQKHKLQKLLPIFDPSINEFSNMVNNGYDRVWDCGSGVFTKIY